MTSVFSYEQKGVGWNRNSRFYSDRAEPETESGTHGTLNEFRTWDSCPADMGMPLISSFKHYSDPINKIPSLLYKAWGASFPTMIPILHMYLLKTSFEMYNEKSTRPLFMFKSYAQQRAKYSHLPEEYLSSSSGSV